MTLVCLNGEILPLEEARIAPNDRGLLLGDGVFETLAVRDGRIQYLSEHLKRLADSALVIGLTPPDEAVVSESCGRLLAEAGLESGLASLRITWTRGPGPRGLLPPAEPTPTLLVTAQAASEPGGAPMTAILATTRRNDQSPLSRIKCLNYLDQVLASQEAAARGANDAVLLNTAGRLACMSVANLFMVRGGRLMTPGLGEGVLPGIVRARILALAEGLGLASETGSYAPEDLLRSEEAFVTNSLVGVRPLGWVEGQSIGDGTAGPVTQRLKAALAAEAS